MNANSVTKFVGERKCNKGANPTNVCVTDFDSWRHTQPTTTTTTHVTMGLLKLDFHMREFLSVHSKLFLFLLIGPATVIPFCFTTSEKRDGTAAKCVGSDDNDDKLRWVCHCVRKLW